MPIGTSEQSNQVRHRRRVTISIFVIGGFLWLVGGIAIGRLSGERPALAFTMFAWLFGFCGFLVFSITYWCCPVCGHYFPRGSRGQHCAHCNTTFNA